MVPLIITATESLLIIPVGFENKQKLFVITKASKAEYKEEIYEDVAFVPMLSGTSNGEIK